MGIELRILTGARAGQTEWFDKDVIAIGRHPASDFLLDVKKDLDVSRRHGEIRQVADGLPAVRQGQHERNLRQRRTGRAGRKSRSAQWRQRQVRRAGSNGDRRVQRRDDRCDRRRIRRADRSPARDPFDDDEDDAPGLA